MAQPQRFLVKMRAPAGDASVQLFGAAVPLRIRPLFQSIGAPAGLGLAAGASWHIVEPALALDAGNPWDMCHAMVTQGLGLAGAALPEFAEPDLAQSWISGAPEAEALALHRVVRTSRPEDRRQRLSRRCRPALAPGRRPFGIRPRARRPGTAARQPARAHRPPGHRLRSRAPEPPGPARDRAAAQLRRRPDSPTMPPTRLRVCSTTGATAPARSSLLAGAPGRRPAAARRGALRPRGADAGRRPRGAVPQQRDRAGARPCPRAVRDAGHRRRCRDAEHGRPRERRLGRCGQRAVRGRGGGGGRGRQQLRQPADAPRRLPGPLQPRHRRLRRDGRPARPTPTCRPRRWPATTGRPARCAPPWRPTRPTCPGPSWAAPRSSTSMAPAPRRPRRRSPPRPPLWLQQNRAACGRYTQPWMRVEAVRRALFDSALASDPAKLGRGCLQVVKALAIAPAPPSTALKSEAPTAPPSRCSRCSPGWACRPSRRRAGDARARGAAAFPVARRSSASCPSPRSIRWPHRPSGWPCWKPCATTRGPRRRCARPCGRRPPPTRACRSPPQQLGRSRPCTCSTRLAPRRRPRPPGGCASTPTTPRSGATSTRSASTRPSLEVRWEAKPRSPARSASTSRWSTSTRPAAASTRRST